MNGEIFNSGHPLYRSVPVLHYSCCIVITGLVFLEYVCVSVHVCVSVGGGGAGPKWPVSFG